jgi:hypothetical protein
MTVKGSRVSRVKITVSGKPNLFNYCVIFIVYVIRKCGRGPRVGHGWFREKSGGKRTVLKQAFSPLDGENLLNQPQLGVWETAWCVGNCATSALLCLQTYVCEDNVLLSCVSITPAERFRPLWVQNTAQLYTHLKNLLIFLGTSESSCCKATNFTRLTNPMPPDSQNAGSQNSLHDWLCFRRAVHLQRIKIQA